MPDTLTLTIQQIVNQQVQKALGPHLGALEQLAAFLRSNGVTGLGRGRGGRIAVSSASGAACAIIGCHRPARSKGYCAAHYQKFRNLSKTHRLPSDWTDPASPQSVKDLVLPRGRAAHKAKRAKS
jgi:hypothetical protein